ncbi:MAG: FAD-binding oxidoreductase [Succinivibrio sp.]|nr:FAD-binding oxidoreductase [Succinivibrio sp.]
MIPSIQHLPKAEPLYFKFLRALKKEGFSGDLDASYASRLLCATDNSVYQKMPEVVVFPKKLEDLEILLKLRATAEYRSLVITARGGGTGTNGQSLNAGIIIDNSRYLKGILNFDQQQHEVRVQAGVIKDELNEYLKPYGLFFSPELSTSNRATIGGMISNDAAGQGSLKYGRTSSHVKAVKVALLDGTVEEFSSISGTVLKTALKKPGLLGDIYRQCYELLKEKASEVEEHFPKLNRFMTGYDLAHAYDAKTDTLNLARLICGSEGTLGVIAEAVLDLTEIPQARELLVVKYADFDSALRHAVELIDAGVFSVETVDSKVLGLAQQDSVWFSVKDYIRDVPNFKIAGVNIVEFNGAQGSEVKAQVDRLLSLIEERSKTQDGGILGVQRVSTAQGIAAVYGMRKKAVGLLGAAAGRRKLVPFTEDTVVPPRELADYILEFRALLDSMQVPYGMFGHVDCGLMHVRPALDLTTDEDRQKLVTISEEVVKLVKKYHGQMWGEHGRGYRACFGETFFGSLYPAARRIKEIFDKDNVLNPGKICVPLHNAQDTLVALDGPMRGDLDRTIKESVRENFKGAVSCNGNGQCFSYKKSDLMCPSYRFTKDHVRSPKGYSELMRTWLQLMTKEGFNPSVEELSLLTKGPSLCNFMRRLYNTLTCRHDFNHEYLEATKTCLSCKSCKSICPAHVNAADLNSRFLSLYYGRYLRPRMDLLVLNAEWLVPLLSKLPRLGNFFLKNRLCKLVNEKLFGLIDHPLFSEHTLASLCKKQGFKLYTVEQALKSDREVMLITDPFTSAYDAEGLVSFASLLNKLGFKVGLLRSYVNGKLQVIRGNRQGFIKSAVKQAARLESLAERGMTLVGYDPALTICYRDEYVQLLGQGRGEFFVALPEEFLAKALRQPKVEQKLKLLSDLKVSEPYYLFAHCTEQALLPESVKLWQEIFKAFALTLEPVPLSCCGMAGLHGHMAEYREETYRVYRDGWQKALAQRPFDRCLVTGFSCRSQVMRMEGRRPAHPLAVLDTRL